MTDNHTSMKFLKSIVSITRLSILLLIINLGTFAFAESNNNDVIIIIPNQVEPYKTIVESIRREFRDKRRSEKLRVLNLSVLKRSSQKYLQGNKLVIPIGTKAINFYLNSNTNSAFVASFTTHSAFSAITRKPIPRSTFRKYFVGGVSLEQPSKRLAYLAKFIKPNISTVGVVLGPNSKEKSNIRQPLAQLGANLNVANIRTNDNPVKKLRNVFQKSQLFIVFPDKSNFNRSLARWIIALSYKHHVPVISYSKKYVDAGALMSLYSEPKQIGKQTAEVALAYLEKRFKPKKLLDPKYYNLAINESVKHALNLEFPSKKELLIKLQKVSQ